MASSSSNNDTTEELGPAVTVALLLQDWERNGLTERVCYHFALSDALHLNYDVDDGDDADENLTAPNNNEPSLHLQQQQKLQQPPAAAVINNNESSNNINHQIRLLECVPTKQWHKLTRRQKRALKLSIQQFNKYHNGGSDSDALNNNNKKNSKPPPFPLKMNPQTRVFFAYEMTRIAVCLDASPTLTSTFGFSNHRGSSSSSNSSDASSLSSPSSASCCCCPMDRFLEMSKQFWSALVVPVAALDTVWKPVIAVTVLAVFPRAMTLDGDDNNNQQQKQHHHQHTNVLVRDYRVDSAASAERLAQKLREWCHTEIETEIARRLSHHGTARYHEIPLHCSRWSDWMQAGRAALSSLSDAARPCILVATDGRSVACDGILDIVDPARHGLLDTAVSVLDLSSPTSHLGGGQQQHSTTTTTSAQEEEDDFHLLNHDPRGALFPLHLSDDSEAVYRACQATGGSFFDAHLLELAATTHAGCQNRNSSNRNAKSSGPNILERDAFFAWKRHSIQPNAVQWYVLFGLSPLSPVIHASWGKLPPPLYLERRLSSSTVSSPSQQPQQLSSSRTLATATTTTTGILNTSISDIMGSGGGGGNVGGYPWSMGSDAAGGITAASSINKRPQTRTTFSTYIINPIPINEILLMRVKEGYRAKQYGQVTSEHDRVSIQFVLDLDLGSTIHYELSYKALPQNENGVVGRQPNLHRLIGFAHIKIELSGDAVFISSVKNDFLHPQQQQQGAGLRGRTMAQQISARLCTHLRWIRKEDMLQSYLSPVRWSDQLSSSDTPFIRRLGSLSEHQRRRHFCLDEIDCVLVGRMPWEEDDFFLSEFRDDDDGEQQLVEALEDWSTQTIREGQCFVRQTNAVNGVAGYCVIELFRSPVASRVFTIVLETFGGLGATGRLALIASLKNVVQQLKAVEMLPKQMAKFLVGEIARENVPPHRRFYQEVLESHHNHASWDLVKDPELLPLLMKRRKEIGQFFLMDSSDDRALFARLFREDGSKDEDRDPGNLAQYQLAVHKDKVVVDLHMESEGGTFFPFRQVRSKRRMAQFHLLVRSLKIRDQECGHALRCRTTLLRSLDERQSATTEETNPTESHASCVQQLLAYASRTSIRLRFFHEGSGAANTILQSLTVDMMLSQTLGPRVAKLSIQPETGVEDMAPGDWFIIQYNDKETVSIVHLSQNGENDVSTVDGRSSAYRILTFFTFGISDLYSIRDDVAEEESDDGHISEHLRVTEFSDAILRVHKQNYSSAAYLALKRDSVPHCDHFNLDDFADVMGPLEFVEVARVLVAGESTRDGEVSKLWSLLETVLHSIANQLHCLFYENYEGNKDIGFHVLESDSDAASVFEVESNEMSMTETNTNTEEDRTRQSSAVDDDMPTEDGSLGFESTDLDGSSAQSFVPPPIFVRFLLDDQPVSIEDLNTIERSSSLAALVSVFKTKDGRSSTEFRKAIPSELQLPHLSAALELSSLMNAHVAEQCLERLRYQGSSIEEVDIQLAKTCLRKARHIMSSSLDVFFYVARTDSIVPASAPSGLNAEIEDGFNLLASELRKVKEISFRHYRTSDKFLIETIESGSSALAYWCFVKIERALGLISIDIHHPGGAEAASELMNSIVYIISICCHRVNQLILLRRLHRSRTASRFLIPPDDSKRETELAETEPSPFHDGVFSCPIVYRTSFELYHRCATNPEKVARALEATVLHIFAVSNRRKSYVYKDESGAVFYLGLSVSEGSKGAEGNDGTEREAQIELLVHGVDKPGPSVTVQLVELLQKKLLTIAVDMLSAVLTKNPQYHWRRTDIDFVRSFETAWNSLESERKSTSNDMVRTYTLPSSVFDPGLIVLYFRQNICGSTFFHPLLTSEWTASVDLEIASVKDANLHFDETDLVVYFNTAPAKLDRFQSESTLTRRGAELSRQTGSGIGIVEILLLDKEGRRLQDLLSAIPTIDIESRLQMAPESLRLKEASNSLSERTGDLVIQVRIVDTALNRNILHEWVKLSMEQVLTSWNVEKQLERMQRNLFRPMRTVGAAIGPNSAVDRLQKIESICPGLPALTGLLESGEHLPHPAILKLECSGVIRSSTVASVALELLEQLERGILDNLRLENKKKLFIDAASQICIIRSCRSAKPHRVTIEWDATSRNAIVKCATERKEAKPVVKDSPIDCPEYTVLFHSADYLENRSEAATKIPKLFDELLVGFESSGDALESPKPLEEFKRQNLSCFRRSFVFILSVKRNQRVLLAYNWNAKLFKSLTSRLTDKDASFLAATGQSVASLQQRSMGRLAPPVGESKQRRPKANIPNAGSTKQTKARPAPSDVAPPRDEPESSDYQRPVPRVKRPQMIRRPILVGKSVEGSAMHAVARSRARASANRFRGGSQTGSSAAGAGNAPKDDPATRKSTVTGSAKSIPLPPRAPAAPASLKPEDKDLEKVKTTIKASASTPGIVQQPSLCAAAYRTVTKAFWPLKTKHDVSLPVADFIFSIAPLVWYDVSEMLPVPVKVLRAFIVSLGQTVSAWTPGLTVVPIRSGNEAENVFFLIGKVRNVRNSKCCVAVKLSMMTFRVSGREKTVVASEGRILTLPRRRGNIPTTQAWIEHDSAGLNKLAADTHQLISLQATLLDHAASMIERTMKSDEYHEYNTVLSLLRRLIDRYPLHPVIALKSNYKCYQATIVLRSYGDRFIDLFDGPTLFKWLASNLDKRDSLLNCGPNGLCFKREIVVRATHSICFLSYDKVSPGKMKLNILCRSQKMDLREFMFREGSTVAVSIFDSINIDAAGLAYKELRFAAKSLEKERLWYLCSTSAPRKAPSFSEMAEMMSLCTVKPISETIDSSGDAQRLTMIYRNPSLLKPKRCCACMKRDPVFQPSWELVGDDGCSVQHLFYFCSDDVFFLLKGIGNDSGFDIDIIERDSDEFSHQRTTTAVQKLTNFLLHFVWSEMALH